MSDPPSDTAGAPRPTRPSVRSASPAPSLAPQRSSTATAPGSSRSPRSRPNPHRPPALERQAPRLVQGDTLTADIGALAADGTARAVVDDRELRVRGGVPGDRATLRIDHVGKHAAWATVVGVDRPSVDRVEAPCPVVLRCGGCPWQMVAPQAQTARRETLLRESLGDALPPEATFHPTVSAGEPVGYRTRALMVARHVAGALRLGLYAPRSNDLVPAEGCVVQHPRLNQALEAARDVLAGTNLGTWRGPNRPGDLRALSLRLDPHRGEGLLTIVAPKPDHRLTGIARALLDIPAIAGVHLCLNDRPGGQLLAGRVRHLAGATRQRIDFGDTTVLAGPLAFVQTHHAVAEAMVARVAKLLPQRVDHLVDLYAGVGVFGLTLRGRAGGVTLVERGADACRDARANTSRLPACDHVEVIEGAVEQRVTDALTGGPAEAVVLDPPRAGCRPGVIEALVARAPGTIVYASCGPKALARDLRALTAGGYRLTDVVPLDMFPHTPHVEVLARLERAPPM
ncbi:MAG: 23S rRNA (uracil(1939)-C(5))-methyltransferase RlmD [Proteobacteria bacterium]|nr:MAG: 23S rRNA (uracil(1939)-C(5))-methyltransferase RlmD [Pseudomonadota bacterium]